MQSAVLDYRAVIRKSWSSPVSMSVLFALIGQALFRGCSRLSAPAPDKSREAAAVPKSSSVAVAAVSPLPCSMAATATVPYRWRSLRHYHHVGWRRC
jgi:hypothetical protein